MKHATGHYSEKRIDFDTYLVERWIAQTVPILSPPFRWTFLAGGHSNLTYLLEDGKQRKVVLRRPPVGNLLPKAHDMAREWTIISALSKTAVKVPSPIAFCSNNELMGASFYLMEYINGHTLHEKVDTENFIPLEKRRSVALSFIDQLADLHSLNPADIGLESLASPKSYIVRQIKRWYGSWASSIEAARYDDPRAHDQMKALQACIPDEGMAKIVHGDYGLHNTLISPEYSVAAVIDWEIATLGDPIADFAYALNRFPDNGIRLPNNAATLAAGFPTRDEMTQRYSDRTGCDLTRLSYFCAFNFWKSAAILHGVYARYVSGVKDSSDVDLNKLRQGIGDQLANAELALSKVK